MSGTEQGVMEQGALSEEQRSPGFLLLQLLAVRVLVQRDLVRFFRQRSRVIGALIQPLIFWLVIGSGLSGSFRMAGAEGLSYMQYFFPGILVLVVLFTSIFTTMSVIEDRQHGFLQAVLTAPAARPALVLGKTLGGVAIALSQALLMVLLGPLAGFPLGGVDWPNLVLLLGLAGVALSALGFTLAWVLHSTPAYHVVMNLLLIPLWVLSGAMFPVQGAKPWLTHLMHLNPMSFAVAGVRRALYGVAYPAGQAPPGSSAALELGVVVLFAALMLLLATWQSGRNRRV